MPSYVGAVIQYDVQPFHLRHHVSEKLRIVLGADPHATGSKAQTVTPARGHGPGIGRAFSCSAAKSVTQCLALTVGGNQAVG
jgi:hypothetical protein